MRVRGNPAHGPTDGVLCAKVSRYTERTYHPQRVLTPLRRTGPKGSGRFEPVGWDEALADIAARLAAIKEEQPEALQPSAVYPNNPEDLKIVEGIGPKIEQILKAAGINTWKDLAETEPDKLRTLLDQAGDRFRMHDPSTWPQQAQLAANSQWEMLKEYQDFLVGGRDPGE